MLRYQRQNVHAILNSPPYIHKLFRARYNRQGFFLLFLIFLQQLTSGSSSFRTLASFSSTLRFFSLVCNPESCILHPMFRSIGSVSFSNSHGILKGNIHSRIQVYTISGQGIPRTCDSNSDFFLTFLVI